MTDQPGWEYTGFLSAAQSSSGFCARAAKTAIKITAPNNIFFFIRALRPEFTKWFMPRQPRPRLLDSGGPKIYSAIGCELAVEEK